MASPFAKFLTRAAVPRAGLGNLLVNPGVRQSKGAGPAVATMNVSWQSPGQPQILDTDAQAFGEEAYLGQVYVMRCIQTIANTISGLEFRAGLNPMDPQNTDTAAPLVQLLGPASPQAPGGPNPRTASRAFWCWSICQYLVYGRFAWECQLGSVPGMNGQRGSKTPIALWPLVASCMNAVPSQGGSEFFESYIYQTPQYGNIKLNPEQVIYAWRPSLTDWRVPETVLSAAKLPIYIAKGLDRYMAKLLQNDMVASTLVVTPPFDEPSARRAWQEQFLTSFSGVDNRGKTIFAEAEYDESDTSGKPLVQVEKIAQTAVEASLLEIAKTAKDEICCVPGTQIVTKRGLVNVEDIQVGDEVFTHEGRWRSVTSTMVHQPYAPVYTMSAKGLDDLSLTGNHKVFAARYTKTHADTQVKYQGMEWVRTDEMRPKGRQRRDSHAMTVPKIRFVEQTGSVNLAGMQDFAKRGTHSIWVEDGKVIHSSSRVRPVPCEVKLTPALGRLLGLYLAEGCTGGHQVIWNFNENETDLQQQVVDDMMEVFGLPATISPSNGHGVKRVVVSSQMLTPLFRCGTAASKMIPQWAWEGDETFFSEVLWGWMAGDGSEDVHNIRGYTRSQALAWHMRIVAIGLGHEANLRRVPAQSDSYIEGRRLRRGGDGWVVAWQKNPSRRGIYRIENDEFLTSPLRTKVLSDYHGPVYNFSVAEDESYLTTGGAVSNCVALGVPLSLIGNAQERIYANAESEYKNFWTLTVMNLLTELQDHINTLLAPRLGLEVGWFDLSRVVALQPPPIFAPPMIGDVINFGIASAAQVANVLGIPAADNIGAEDSDTIKIGEESSSVGASQEHRAAEWIGESVTKGQLIDARIRWEQRPLNTYNWQEPFRATQWLKKADRIVVRSAPVQPPLMEVSRQPEGILENAEVNEILTRVSSAQVRHQERALARRAQKTAELVAHTNELVSGVRHMTVKNRIGVNVGKRLAENYPQSTLGWVEKADWSGPHQVNLDEIDMSKRPGGRDQGKVDGIAKGILSGDQGAIAPVVLVKTPGAEKLQVADGYHRTKAREKLGHEAINAYVGEVEEDEGPWDSEMHSKKLNRAAVKGNNLGPDREKVIWFGDGGLKKTLTKEEEEELYNHADPTKALTTKRNVWLPQDELDISHCAYCGEPSTIAKTTEAGALPLCNNHASMTRDDFNIGEGEPVVKPFVGVDFEGWLKENHGALLDAAEMEDAKESK